MDSVTALILPCLKIPAPAVPENVNSADATPAVRNRAEVANRRLHFSHAWPLKNHPRDGKQRVIPPFPNAEAWQCSVYYYWWEYLRRHEGYTETCARNGKGKYKKLYEDFGDVHATDFWTWWRTHNYIFAEPPIRQVKHAEPGERADTNTVILSVPLDTKLSLTTAQFKRLVRPILKEPPSGKSCQQSSLPSCD